jgi:hypothetical protein
LTDQKPDAAAQRRARQTLINLLLALGATLAIALTLVLIVPRDDSNLIKPVDYKPIAENVHTSTGLDVLAPAELPTGWWVNSARWSAAPADGVQSWHIGFVGPKNQYIGVDQAFKTNATWVSQKLVGYEMVTVYESGQWTISEYKGITDKNRDQSFWLYLLNDGEQAVLYTGTATRNEFAQFAKLLNLHFN